MGFRDEEEPGRAEHAQSGAERDRGRPPPLLLMFALLLLALLAVAAILLWRSFGESISGTSVARDSIDSAGPEPRVRLANAAGQVRVVGVEGSGSVDYEATRYAMAADPASPSSGPPKFPWTSPARTRRSSSRRTGGEYGGRLHAQDADRGSVEVESEVGDVEVSGISGNVTVSAEAGDVRVTDVGGDVEVQTPRGDVSVADVNTDTGSANLEAGVGDVSLEDLILGTLEASVEAGDVILSGRFSGGGRITVQTGDIIARLPPDDARDLTLETRVGSVLREPAASNGGFETGKGRSVPQGRRGIRW